MSLENNNSVINTESTNGYVSSNGNSTNNGAYNTNLNQNGSMPPNSNGAYPQPPVKSPKDKKKTVMIIVGIVIAVVVLIVALAVGIHIAKEAKYPKYDLNDYIVSNVEVSGIVGDTKLMMGDTEITDKNASSLINWLKFYDIQSVVLNTFSNDIRNYIKVSLDTDVSKLSNGDSVYIKVNYDNKKLKKVFGFKLTGDRIKVVDEVSGLKSKDDLLDIFNYVDVSFDGYDGLASVSIKPKKDMPALPKILADYSIEGSNTDYSDCTITLRKNGAEKATFQLNLNESKSNIDSEYITDVDFDCYKIKNGDKVYISVEDNENNSKDVELLSDSKQFTVSGLGKLVNPSTKIDEKDIKTIIETANKEINANGQNVSSKDFYHLYLFENNANAKTTMDKIYGAAFVSAYIDKEDEMVEIIISYRPYMLNGKLMLNKFESLEYGYNYYDDSDILKAIKDEISCSTEPTILK